MSIDSVTWRSGGNGRIPNTCGPRGDFDVKIYASVDRRVLFLIRKKFQCSRYFNTTLPSFLCSISVLCNYSKAL